MKAFEKRGDVFCEHARPLGGKDKGPFDDACHCDEVLPLLWCS